MTESLNIKREYKHFIRYDQDCFDGMKYGPIDLFYDINDSTLFIKKIDPRDKSEKELNFPLQNQKCKH